MEMVGSLAMLFPVEAREVRDMLPLSSREEEREGKDSVEALENVVARLSER